MGIVHSFQMTQDNLFVVRLAILGLKSCAMSSYWSVRYHFPVSVPEGNSIIRVGRLMIATLQHLCGGGVLMIKTYRW
jgi:hypothetical protein